MRVITGVVVAATLILGPIAAAAAEHGSLQVPQSIRLQHAQIIDRLADFAKRKGPVGAAASKALAFLKDHYAKEEALVLAPLGLLPRLAKGEVAKDMEPAIAMAERTRAGLSEFQKDHVRITSLMNELVDAGKNNGDESLVRLATRIANQSLNDIEVAQPTTILIGEYLRQKLSKGR